MEEALSPEIAEAEVEDVDAERSYQGAWARTCGYSGTSA